MGDRGPGYYLDSHSKTGEGQEGSCSKQDNNYSRLEDARLDMYKEAVDGDEGPNAPLEKESKANSPPPTTAQLCNTLLDELE